MAEPTLDFESFKNSLSGDKPPAESNMALRALWHDAKGNDESALRAACADSTAECVRVRAYLYRKSGDQKQARLWYWKAGTSEWQGSSESEWADIVQGIITSYLVASAYEF